MGWDRKTEQTSRRRARRLRRAGVTATLLVATLTVAFGSSMVAVAETPEPDVAAEPTTDTQPPADQTPPPADTTVPSDTEPVPPVEELSTEDETAPPGDSAAPAAPVDDDGVPAWIEDGAPNGGDGNGDGILDSLQANVASLPSVYDVDGNGALDDYITIESPEGTTLAKVKALAVPAAPAPPDGATFPAGLVDYDVHVANPGDRADVKLYLPDGEHGAVYMFQGGEWSDFTHRAEIDNAANEVTLRLVDGGAGDENGTDGVIHDPVGVATPPAATTSFTVRTDNVPEPGVTFVYTLFACNNGSGTPSAIGSCTSVATSPALADGAEHTFTNITVSGNQWFRVQRAANTSWIVSSITCSGGTNQNTADIANRSGAVRLSSGAASGGQCSFLNAQAGTVSVIKQTVPDGPTNTFNMRLGRCGAASGDSCTNDLDNNPVSPSPQAVTDNNSATWTLTQNGRYVLDEGSNPGWSLSAPACTGATNQSANGSTGRIFFVADRTTTAVVCTFTNTSNASVTVNKVTTPNPNDPTLFTFQLQRCTNTNTSCGDANWANVGGTVQVPGGGSFIWSGLDPGSGQRNYRILETIPAGWNLQDPRTCSGASASNGSSPAANGAVLRIQSGQNAAQCTFTNTPSGPGTITVRKGGIRGTVPGGSLNYAAGLAGATFEYSADNGTTWLPLPGCSNVGLGQATNASGNCTSGPLPVGVYLVREGTAPAGWSTITSLTYGGNQTGAGNVTRDYAGTATVVSGQTAEVFVQHNNAGATVEHRFVNYRANNSFPNACGLSLSLVLDESGSVGSDAPAYATAAKGFIDALAGSPTIVYISSFSDGASNATSSPFNLSIVPGVANPAGSRTGVAGAKAAIDDIYAAVGGGTNWDAALRGTLPNNTDVTILLTDGNPTVWGTNNTTQGTPSDNNGTINLYDLTAGIASANSVKATGTKLIAVGVGAGITLSNLQALAGDDVFTGSLSGLQNTLQSFANQLCGAQVHVRKLVDGQLTNGWTFTGATTTPGASIVHPSGTVSGQGGNVTGQVQVNVNSVPAPPGGANVTVTETVQGGFSFVSGECRTGGTEENPFTTGSVFGGVTSGVATLDGIQRNQKYYCTFNNVQNPGNIIIKKTGVGAGEGSPFVFSGPGTPFGVNGLTLTTQTNGSTETSQTYVVPANTGAGYVVSENGPPAGWDFTSLSCTNPDGQNASTTVGQSATIRVNPGETVTCTWTNTKRGNIIIKKTGVGAGEGSPFVFSGPGTPFGVNGLTLTTQTNGSTETSQTYVVPANTGAGYVVSENGPPAGWDFTSLSCTNPDGQNASTTVGQTATIRVNPGETVTCTWKNTKQAKVTVVKQAVGGEGTFTFELTQGGDDVAGQGALSLTAGPASPADDDTDSWFWLAPGSGYGVAEGDLPEGWASDGAPVCTRADQSAVSDPSDFALAAGDVVTCVFSNTKQAKVNVVKKAVGGSGTFTFSLSQDDDPVDGQGPLSLTAGPASPADDDTDSWFWLAPGSGYGVAEGDLPEGWASDGAPVCTRADQSAVSDPSDFALAAGDVVICVFSNTKQAKVNVVKKVVGGSGTFTFSLSQDGDPVDGQAPLNLSASPGNDGTGSWFWLTPGDEFAVAEGTLPEGWVSDGPPDCSYANQDSADPDDFDLAAGDVVTCVFSNTKQASIIIKKVAKGGDDGTFGFDGPDPGSAADFSLSPTTPTGNPNEFSDQSNLIPVEPGTYVWSELDPPAGWDFTAPITCDDGLSETPSTVDGQSATIKVDPGETVTCTWTNTKRAVIKVQKITVPAGQDDDFTFELTHPNQSTQTQTVSGTDPATAFANKVLPNTAYAVTETGMPTGPPIWDPNGGDCYLEVLVEEVLTLVGDPVNPASVTPGPGETWTCVFTNTLRATITVVKTTDPSDSTQGFDFTLSGGPTPADPIVGLTSQQLNGKQFAPTTGVKPGTYTVDETDPGASWIEDPDPRCDRADTPYTNEDKSAVDLVVGAGENWICTFHNVQKGSVTVVKTSVGGTGTFSFTLKGPGQYGPSQGGSVDTGVDNPGQDSWGPLVPGSYRLSETDPGQKWIQGDFSCTYAGSYENPVVGAKPTIDLQAGQAWTCEITNWKKARIVVEKVTVTPNQYDETTFEFKGALSGSIGDGGKISAYVDPADGPFKVRERAKDKWALVSIECDEGGVQSGARKATYTPDYGEKVKCTFTNGQARIKVKKVTVTPNQSDHSKFDFSGDLYASLKNGQSASKYVAAGAADNPSSYSTTEAAKSKWALVSIVCGEGGSGDGLTATYSVSAGDKVTCTFTNGQARIKVKKVTITPNRSDRTKFDFSGDITASLKDGQSASKYVAAGSEQDPSSYDVTEAAKNKWALVGIECGDGGTPDVENRTAEFSVSAGDKVTCEFTNGQARIKVKKVTVTPNAEDDTKFWFSGDITAGLKDGQSASKYVAAGSEQDPSSYDVTEAAKNKWALVGIECDEGGSGDGLTATYSVSAGDKVTCVFTNGQARIRVQKETVTADLPDDTEFSFSGDIAASLGDGQSASELVAAGTDPTDYSVTEGDAPGWALTLIECDEGAEQSGAREATYSVSAGDDLLCTFTNTELGTITIVKDTGDPAVGVVFSYDATGGLDPATFDLDTDLSTGLGDSRQFSDVLPDTYSVTEDELAEVFGHWALALPVTCVSDLGDGGSTFTQIDAQDGVTNGGVSIEFLAGDDVICTFANSFVQATATVRVTKRVIIDGVETTGPESAGIFRMTVASAGTSFSHTEDLTEGGDSAGFVVPAGLGYSVTEDESLLLPNWHLEGIECEATESDTRQGQSVDAADFAVFGGEIIDCLVTNDPATDVGGISVLPNTGSPVEMAIKAALWALGLGGLLLLLAKRRQRHHADLAA